MEIAAHAMSVRTTMPPLVSHSIYQIFSLQDEHNASYIFNMSWNKLPHSKHKINKFL